MDYERLVKSAEAAKENAYAPYSNFRVGAALMLKDGSIYSGANIENASFGATNCAERTAAFKAVFDGKNEFEAIAIASDSDSFIYPCGICRQVLAEFGREEMKIICSNKLGEYRVHTLGELLPNAFTEVK